jgi:hypothetical protein
MTFVRVAVVALVAGFLPALLFFRPVRMGSVFALGISGIAFSWLLVGLTNLPPIVVLGYGSVPVYPFWAFLTAFVAGAAANVVAAYTGTMPNTAEQVRRIREELDKQNQG